MEGRVVGEDCGGGRRGSAPKLLYRVHYSALPGWQVLHWPVCFLLWGRLTGRSCWWLDLGAFCPPLLQLVPHLAPLLFPQLPTPSTRPCPARGEVPLRSRLTSVAPSASIRLLIWIPCRYTSWNALSRVTC